MIGKCNKDAAYTFNHAKGDAMELLKILNANFARNSGSDTSISSPVDGIINADVMRIKLKVNCTKARILIDTEAVISFVAEQFVEEAGIPTVSADTPCRVDPVGHDELFLP